MANVTGEKKKILLVDDNDMHLTTAELFLKDEFELFMMHSGKEALDYMCGNKLVPHLIMLDIMMPNMNGWEVFKKIRAIDFLKDVPIAFLTSTDEEKERKQAIKIGAAGYITKPYNMTELKSKVQDALSKSAKKRI